MELRWPIARKKKRTREKSIKSKDPVKTGSEKIIVDLVNKGTDASIDLKHMDASFNSVFGTEDNKLIYKGQD